MKLSIRQPLGYSYLGGRSNNEDNIFPGASEATPDQRWFIVCDGVGGAARGEIASHIAVEGFNEYFTQNPEAVATQAYIQAALDYVQAQFDDYLNRHPEGQGMATTLTLVFFNEAGATVAHIGDSRVYHLRNGKVIWRTEDHSLVNQLVRAGVISREEAREHPQRNVIERAIQGSSKAVKPDVQLINDVRPNDYFFLCTDGVLERVSDELLENVLGSSGSNEQKKQTLIDCCAGKTKDNFSAYLLQIDTVSGEVPDAYHVEAPTYSRPEALPDETIAVVAVDSMRTIPIEEKAPLRVDSDLNRNTIPKLDNENVEPRKESDSILRLLTVALLAVALTMGGMSVYKWLKRPPETGKAEHVAADHGKRHDLPVIPKPKPSHSQLPDEAAVEGITQVIGERADLIEITPNLYKKQVGAGWILVNEKGQQKSSRIYDEIRDPSDKFIAVRQNDKWGYINLKGKMAIACQFEQASDFENDKAHVLLKGEEYDIDKSGKPLEAKTSQQESLNRSGASVYLCHQFQTCTRS